MAHRRIRLPETEYCKEYLRHAKSLEYDRYILEEIIKKLTNARRANMSAVDMYKSIIEDLNNPSREQVRLRIPRISIGEIILRIFEAIPGIIAYLIMIPFLMIGIIYIGNRFNIGAIERFVDLAYTTSNPLLFINLFGYIFPYAVLFAIMVIAKIYKVIKESFRKGSERRAVLRQIQIMKDEIRMGLAIDAAIEKEIGRCTEQLRKLNMTRDIFYRGDLIPEKYRSLVPISMIHEYFETRICTTLDGPFGAFARYETDHRLDNIAAILSDIRSRMDVVIRNQGLILNKLYEIDGHLNDMIRIMKQNGRKIDTANTTLQDMHKNLDRIEHNTELTEYYSEVTARCIKHEMWLEDHTKDSEP